MSRKRGTVRKYNKIFLGNFFISRRKESFFETAEEDFRKQSQSNVWEPGENPGRLRHCNGYKLPMPPSESSGRRE
jgi:hypothetical protein